MISPGAVTVTCADSSSTWTRSSSNTVNCSSGHAGRSGAANGITPRATHGSDAVSAMLGVGYLAGFRLRTSLGALAAAAGLLLLSGFAISWVTALLGLVAKSAEAAAAASLPLTVLVAFPPAPSC